MMNSKSKVGMSNTAIEARRAYYRAYYAQNRDRIQQKRAERWEQKVQQMKAADSK